MSDKECIYREDAINIKRKYDGYMSRDVAYAFWRELVTLPAAPVREVERHQWKMTPPDKLNKRVPYCPKCGEKALFGSSGIPKKSKFCPNCGADMGEFATGKDAGGKEEAGAMSRACYNGSCPFYKSQGTGGCTCADTCPGFMANDVRFTYTTATTADLRNKGGRIG